MEVLTNFKASKGNATAILYAFRFIDSPSVKFECVVTFCENENCVSGAYNATTPSSRRRRRTAVEISPEKKYQVSASYRIVEPEQGQPSSSKAAVRFHPTLTTFLVFLAAVASRRINPECFF